LNNLLRNHIQTASINIYSIHIESAYVSNHFDVYGLKKNTTDV